MMPPYNSLIVLMSPKGRRRILRVEEGKDWHSGEGVLRMADVAEKNYGDEVLTSLGHPLRIHEPTLHDLLKGVKRQTQIIYPKDIAYICLRLGAGHGRTIIEAGSGSGALTTALSWFSGPNGKIVSYEAREEFHRLARRNLTWAGVGENVELVHRDIAEGFTINGADALFLDVRTPWEYLDHALAAVRPGATFGFLLPTVNQTDELLLALERGPFDDIEISELLLRRWKTNAGRLRPDDRMIAHTGFLIFCRKQERGELFESLKPVGTRERKQIAARLERMGEDGERDADVDD